MLVSLLSFVFLAGMLVSSLVGGGSGLTWNHMLLGTVLLMGGITLFTIGVLCVYVGRIHRESIGRPWYLVDEYIGGEE